MPRFIALHNFSGSPKNRNSVPTGAFRSKTNPAFTKYYCVDCSSFTLGLHKNTLHLLTSYKMPRCRRDNRAMRPI